MCSSDLSAAVRIPDSQSYVLPCATNSTLGGIKAQTNTGVISVPDVAESGTYYPIELMKDPGVVTGAECTAIVKVPSVELTCATTTVLGGIKIGGVNEEADPVLGSGTATAVQVNGNCQAFVNVPTVEPYVLPCATAATLGGIKASKVTEVDVPEPANTGDYYPVQVTENQEDDDCTAVVRVPATPLSCANATTLGGIKAGKVDTTLPEPSDEGNYYPIQLIESETGPIENECRAVVRVPDSGVDCATNSTIGGIIVGQGVIPSPVTPPEEGTVYPVQVTNECLAGVRIPNPTLPPDYLIKAVTHSTTITTTTNPSRFPLPQLSASTTPFAQIKFDPSSVTGTTNDVFTVFKRPQNTEHYVKIVVKCTVLTADDDDISDERYLMGLHHSATDVTGANLSYNYQVTGDYDLDDLVSGDQLNQIQFTWYIQVGDLLNSAGSAASSGEDCYIYVKALYDSSSTTTAPSIILGRQWNVNPTTVQGTIEAAGPLEICAYEIQDTKYENNPTPPGTEEEGEEEGDKEG